LYIGELDKANYVYKHMNKVVVEMKYAQIWLNTDGTLSIKEPTFKCIRTDKPKNEINTLADVKRLCVN
jgi:hypothetical protein